MRAPNFKTPLTCCPQKCMPSSLKTRSDKTRKQTTSLGETSPENRALQYMFSVTRTPMLSAASLRVYTGTLQSAVTLLQTHCEEHCSYLQFTAKDTNSGKHFTHLANYRPGGEPKRWNSLYFKFKELEREKWFTRQKFPRKRSKDPFPWPIREAGSH